MDSHILIVALALITVSSIEATNNLDFFREQEFDFASHLWANSLMGLDQYNTSFGCSHCGDVLEPPPDDILFMPSPPLHPKYYDSLNNDAGKAKQTNDQCNFCNLFYSEGEHILNRDGTHPNSNNQIITLLVAFLSISAILFIYLISTRRTKIIASFTRTPLFKTTQPINTERMDKNNPLNESISNSGVHLSDPCYLQTNRDKNLTSPIISDHVPHKKTSIPSKYWAQPGSIIGRTIRRIPNEYEVPSSRTNSTGTSSAVYADMVNNGDNNQRFFSPYNLHTYAEVREVLDPNEHFHTSSNSSVMLSESNYDNAVYSHGNCSLNNGNTVPGAPNGSVQMSDFNPMRPIQSMSYGQSVAPVNNHLNQATKIHLKGQAMYEQPPQRAQIIITSNNQGVNPTLLNYKERIHNVI